MIAFVVEGNPVPTARPRVVRTKAGIPVAFTPKSSRDYQRQVALCAREAMGGRRKITGPVRLTVAFHRDSERRCDLDNLLKSILDGLTLAGLWADDSQVVELHATKALSRSSPRAEIEVERAVAAQLGIAAAIPQEAREEQLAAALRALLDVGDLAARQQAIALLDTMEAA